MNALEKLQAEHGLDFRDMAILDAIENRGGKATWTDLLKALVPRKMARRTLWKHLTVLAGLGFLVKQEERVNGQVRTFYVAQDLEYLRTVKRFKGQLIKLGAPLYEATQQPGLSMEDRKRLVAEGLKTFLDFHRDLTIMALETATRAPSHEASANRLVVLMVQYALYAAAAAAGFCWGNRDIAADVLEKMLQKGRSVRLLSGP